MSSDPIIVTRDLVKRGWSDFEPKVVAGLLTGSVGAFLIPVAAQFGIHLTAIQANYAVVAFYFVGSYFTPSAGTKVISTTTKANNDVVRSETHSGNAVSTVTASTPIQQPATDPPPAPSALPDSGSVVAAAPEPARPFIWGADGDNNATQVLR